MSDMYCPEHPTICDGADRDCCCADKHEQRTSPYRFTVSVEEEYPGEWWVSLFASTDPEPDDPFVLLNWQPFPTEAEARTAAAPVLAALHQATMEETP